MKALRAAFGEAVQVEDFTRFKLVDETSVNLTYTRRYSQAPGSQLVDQAVPLLNGPNLISRSSPPYLPKAWKR